MQPSAGAIGRMLLDKKYQGDLEATSVGQMLASGTSVPGSAGYVEHSQTMHRGAPLLSITVVPDSGTANSPRLQAKCRSSLPAANISMNSITQ